MSLRVCAAGGGIVLEGGTATHYGLLTVDNCEVSANKAAAAGAGIFVNARGIPNMKYAHALIENSVIRDNWLTSRGGKGAGIRAWGGSIALKSNILVDNSAKDGGCAIEFDGQEFMITNDAGSSLIFNNTFSSQPGACPSNAMVSVQKPVHAAGHATRHAHSIPLRKLSRSLATRTPRFSSLTPPRAPLSHG